MIRHMVFFKAKTELSNEQLAPLFTQLKQLQNSIQGILAAYGGPSQSPEALERGYLHGFTLDFADWDALACYQDHPEHKAFSRALLDATQGGIEGILVFDLDCR